MTMFVPIFEFEITPRSDRDNFCYKNRLLGPLSDQEIAREKAFWLSALSQELGTKVKGESFTYAKKDFEELRAYEKARFGEYRVGGYCSPGMDPHFNPMLVKGPTNIHYDSVYQMFEDLFNYTETVKGTVVGACKFAF